MLFVRRL